MVAAEATHFDCLEPAQKAGLPRGMAVVLMAKTYQFSLFSTQGLVCVYGQVLGGGYILGTGNCRLQPLNLCDQQTRLSALLD
ncbi:MAG TPA: hypothetical protein DCR93_32660 [Cytophagales bacterium]|nr:hypothetical protein [Cytophagales bacterium]HAP64040.1 hypothetical protein [Cytophagales bacterium]